jgi:voltage-gated sodium channel
VLARASEASGGGSPVFRAARDGLIAALSPRLFHVLAVTASELSGPRLPGRWAGVAASLSPLFQIMTLQSWSSGIVRPVVANHPLARLFVVPFISRTTFDVSNLFVALVVSAVHGVHESERQAETIEVGLAELLAELRAIRAELAELRRTTPARTRSERLAGPERPG